MTPLLPKRAVGIQPDRLSNPRTQIPACATGQSDSRVHVANRTIYPGIDRTRPRFFDRILQRYLRPQILLNVASGLRGQNARLRGSPGCVRILQPPADPPIERSQAFCGPSSRFIVVTIMNSRRKAVWPFSRLPPDDLNPLRLFLLRLLRRVMISE